MLSEKEVEAILSRARCKAYVSPRLLQNDVCRLIEVLKVAGVIIRAARAVDAQLEEIGQMRLSGLSTVDAELRLTCLDQEFRLALQDDSPALSAVLRVQEEEEK